MTDEMRAREEAICKVAGVKDIGDLSDGFHTFNQLYYQRMMLFATIVKQNRDKAWKSLRHEDGELCFGGGWFIVGIDTPEGSYTYHYEDNYYRLFDCVELKRGKHWDGHTEKDVTRLLSLPALEKQEQDGWRGVSRIDYYDAIEFLSKNNIYRAIRDLSAIAEERQSKTAKMMAELIAEKRCVRNFVESKELTTEMKIDAINKVTGEE